MSAKLGYGLVSIGTVITFSGFFQVLVSTRALVAVLLWAMVAIVGVFVLGIGTTRVVTDRGGKSAADPRNAPGKTGPSFGWK